MKLRSISVIVALVLAVVNISYVAADSSKCGKNVTFTYSDGVLTLGGSGAMYDYEKGAARPWDKYSNNIKRLVIGDGITKIGDWAFYECENLSQITFSKTLSQIGVRSFYGCKSLTYLELPNGLIDIGSGAFNSCTSVVRVDFPKSLKNIGNSAFMNIPKMRAVTIGENVESIDDYAFFGDTSLSGIYFEGDIPKTLGYYMLTDISEEYTVFYSDTYKDIWESSAKFSPDHMRPYSKKSKIPVYVNNNEVVFDQQPIIVDGRTLVPVRAIFEVLGADVDWDENTHTVTAKRNSVQIQLKIGSAEMYKNGEKINLDVPAKIYGGRTLVPARAVSEAFGCKVGWNSSERAVYIDF